MKNFPSRQTIHTVAFDFDGIFTNNKVYVDQGGRETVQCDRRDGLGFDFVRRFQREGKLQASMMILSKEGNPVVIARAKKLKLDCFYGIGDKLTFMTEHLGKTFPSNKNPFEGLIYVGNDLNDLPLMIRAGFSVAPADAHPRVRAIASLVLQENGGDGFVRAFLELLLDLDKLSSEEIDELVSNC